MFVYVGAYTEPPMGRAEGLYVFRFDERAGTLGHVQTVAGVVNPSFLALGRKGRRLYAVNEQDEGWATAFARDPETGLLTTLNSQSTHGASPCFIALDPSERFALISNYTGGTVVALPIDADGKLEPASSVVPHTGSSVNSARQREPHPHMIAPTPDGASLLATDLGADRILAYRLDPERGTLAERTGGLRGVATMPGSGPRHFAFAPDGRTLYVINELDSTIAVYGYDGNELRHRQTVATIPENFTDYNDCAEIVVAPAGRFVYGSNRGHDSIAIFAVEPASGELTPRGHQATRGRTPRNFNLDPSGRWLLAGNQDSDTIAVFRRDPATGALQPAGDPVPVASPVAILFA